MTGTGTQSDPFIVSNWNDFRTAMSTSGAYVELDADIDMNEVAPTGISKITTNNITLDGKNHAIKNLVANAGFLCSDIRYGTAHISNLKILNFINRGVDSFIYISNGYELYFRHCTILGINESTAKMIEINSHINSSCVYFSSTNDGGCLLNISISSGGFASGNTSITDSRVRLSGGKWTDDNTWHLDNSYLEGKISGSKFEYCYNSVIDAECVHSDNFSVNFCSNLLVNTDRFTNDFSSENGIKKATSEQLVNAEYLENIGFPIGVE